MEQKKTKRFTKKAACDFDVANYLLSRYTDDNNFYEYCKKKNINISQAVRNKIIQYIKENGYDLRKYYNKTIKKNLKGTDIETRSNIITKAIKYAEGLINKKLEEFVKQEKTEIQHQNDVINTNILLKLYDPSRNDKSRFQDFFDKLPELKEGDKNKSNTSSIKYKLGFGANPLFKK